MEDEKNSTISELIIAEQIAKILDILPNKGENIKLDDILKKYKENKSRVLVAN